MEVSRALFRSKPIFLALLAAVPLSSRAEGQIGATVPNWTVPNGASSASPGKIHALGDVTNPSPFIGVTPCRIVDTRGPAGPFGAPSLSPGVPRNFELADGPCAGFSSVNAYSLNITVTNTLGPGFIKIFPEGSPPPVVSTLNYVAGQTVANAAIVPAGTSLGITVVAGVSGADLIIDVNGYFPNFVINDTKQLGLIGNKPGDCILCGLNFSNAAKSSAVEGIGAGANGTTGVLGLDVDSSGIALGTFTPGAAGVTGIANFSGILGVAVDRGVVGLLLDSAGNDLAEGWAGKSGTSTTEFFGIEGILMSTTAGSDAAAVWGVDIGGRVAATFLPAAIRGDSKTHLGVLGVSEHLGVVGRLDNTTGAFLAEGQLGVGGAGGPFGVFSLGNMGATGTKPFIEVHPTDASKEIRYVALEGPEAGTYFRGTSETHNGMAVIPVPETFRMVTDTEGLTVQLTPVGQLATMAVISQDLDQIVVRSSRDVRFHYMVNGVRATFKDWQVITESDFMPQSPTQTMPGYFSEEQKRRLIANGTYNADGTVNMETARRLGWDKVWAARVEADKALAPVNAAVSSDRSDK